MTAAFRSAPGGRWTGTAACAGGRWATAFPVVVAALNRAGLGPLHADVSAVELRRAALRASHEVLGRLEVPAQHVIFGHTHRAGPLPGDDPRQPEWGRLLNTGSWVYEPAWLGRLPARESLPARVCGDRR